MSRVSRWSKRKLEERDTPSHAHQPDVLDDNVVQAEHMHEADLSVHEELTDPPPPGSLDETLPAPETLPAGSDFKAFMAPGVSDALRRRALRRMFSAGHYGIRDGLDDYDDDYRQTLKPLAGELAQRLRQWTKTLDDPEVASEQESEGASDDADTPVESASEKTVSEEERMARNREAMNDDACTEQANREETAMEETGLEEPGPLGKR
ncbi:DUF3306 domain-containing protein [Halomonas urumqiensis]|uniref:DUF3306 domain-containing protein n=1 Tax=Halomonas urumqiensis TaxID=1684789 RepID=A0A2N7UET8_9GAMM|nr:DUF3306 domain-containing protein [Halomonas urumqiensis]PMR78895.1 DUF3306 domain-containing protein [Halomonas urumqiensis]PTB04198.1 DUF3306 domain-containing protein [Halomonas urumqiensis]GHE19528.1 hypothetical protein GCM10017767_00490 [Halomonas urumqiensis]